MIKPNLPQLTTAIFGWSQLMLIGLVGKSQENYQTVESIVYNKYKAVIQPLSMRQIEMKPEGERGWAWVWLHAETALQLYLDDIIIIEGGDRYRVTGRKDYASYGYIEYELVRGYEKT